MADLEGRGFELVKHNLAKERPSRELLGRLVDELGLEAVINPRSPAYKARNLGARKLAKKEAIDLMLEDPNLMRRPLVLSNELSNVLGSGLGKGQVVFGFDPGKYESLR